MDLLAPCPAACGVPLKQSRRDCLSRLKRGLPPAGGTWGSEAAAARLLVVGRPGGQPAYPG